MTPTFLLWVVGVIGLWVELGMLWACAHYKIQWDGMDRQAHLLNIRFGLSLPMQNASWKPSIVVACIMTPLVVGTFVAAVLVR